MWYPSLTWIEGEPGFRRAGSLIPWKGPELPDRKQHEAEVAERKRKHLEAIEAHRKATEPAWRPCLHDACPKCHGTGQQIDGTPCFHALSCPCPKCTLTS